MPSASLVALRKKRRGLFGAATTTIIPRAHHNLVRQRDLVQCRRASRGLIEAPLKALAAAAGPAHLKSNLVS